MPNECEKCRAEVEDLRSRTQYWPSNAERDAVIKYREEQVAALNDENQRLRNALGVSETWSRTVLEAQARDVGEITRLCAEVRRMRAALSGAEAWLDRWAQHVGACRGSDRCICGLTAMRFEARAALEAQWISEADGQSTGDKHE